MEKQKQRTEEEWRRLHESAICAILNGRCANYDFSNFSVNSFVDEALRGADLVIKELKEREGVE